jgi:hypothetical protein
MSAAAPDDDGSEPACTHVWRLASLALQPYESVRAYECPRCWTLRIAREGESPPQPAKLPRQRQASETKL